MGSLHRPLFVYGTLMRGERAHGRVAHAKRVVTATIHGRLYELPGGYPGLVDADTGRVDGELCWFSDPATTLRHLDEYEGFAADDPAGSEYLRVERTVRIHGGGSEPAWCYVIPAPREHELLALGARPVSTRRWSGGARRP